MWQKLSLLPTSAVSVVLWCRISYRGVSGVSHGPRCQGGHGCVPPQCSCCATISPQRSTHPPSHPPIRQGESQHVMTVPRAVSCLELICKATRMLLARAELPVARPQHTIAELPGLTRRTPEADGGASAGEVPSTLAHGRCGGSRLRLLRRGHNMRSCGAGTTVARGSCILTERGAADVSRRV